MLDVNLGGAAVFPAADVLARRGIPVVFATGYGRGAIGPAHGAHVIEKPYTRDKLARALAAALAPQLLPSSVRRPARVRRASNVSETHRAVTLNPSPDSGGGSARSVEQRRACVAVPRAPVTRFAT